MEIPYIVEARKDTGLWNAKIGMWLFLASEVMLFGGLFSAYIFLRLCSDTVWPTEVQNWKLGALNTAILIFSSITIVFAWTSILLKKWKRYVFFMSLTVICSFVFLFLKIKYEYLKKLDHYAIILKDGAVIEGHYPHEHKKNDEHKKSHTKENHAKNPVFPTNLKINLDKISNSNINKLSKYLNQQKNLQLFYYDNNYLKALRKTPPSRGYSPYVTIPFTFFDVDENDLSPDNNKKLLKDELLKNVKLNSISLLRKDKTISPKELKKALSRLKTKQNKYIEIAEKIDSIQKKEKGNFLKNNNFSEIEIQFKNPVPIFNEIDQSDSSYKFTTEKAVHFLADKIDLRNVRERVNDNIDFDKSLLAKQNSLFHNTYWKNEQLDLFSNNIKNLDQTISNEKLQSKKINKSTFEKGKETEIWVNEADIKRQTNWGPSYNNYFGIYYTITGLHGIHVLGGALVMFVFIFFKKMYKKNHILLANRVECLGLFWHFVDLVWIFAFPIFYLF